jgi:Holliday junction DNA helicase RuvB
MLAPMRESEHVFDPEALSEALAPGVQGAADRSAERELETGLRPKSFTEFVGQSRIVGNLKLSIRAARERGDPLDHVLLSGPPGLGKTSLGRIVAHELDARMHATSGPALDKPRDLVGILTQLERGDVLFIDEVHRVPAAIEEYLYTAMEDFSVDFTLDQGPHARVLPLALQPFTLVGATTREGLLTAPFRARFGHFERLEPYPVTDLMLILQRSAGLLGIGIDDDAAELIASRSRGTPRIANRFLRRTRDLAQVQRQKVVDHTIATDALARLGVDDSGLEEMDRRILACLARNIGQPVGLKTIAAAVGEAEDTIEEVFEPHLLRCGFLQRTARGRTITRAGCTVIGVDPDHGDRDASDRSTPGLFE